MRKIDSSAFNEKIINKIKELDFLVKKINPENIKYFDANLIKAAENYIKVLKDCVWSNDSNFNGVEFKKVDKIIKNLSAKKATKYYVDRQIILMHTGTSFASTVHSFEASLSVPSGFDGRSSFVFSNVYYDGDNKVHRKITPDYMQETGGQYVVHKSSSKIKISTFFHLPSGNQYLDVFILYWR